MPLIAVNIMSCQCGNVIFAFTGHLKLSVFEEDSCLVVEGICNIW